MENKLTDEEIVKALECCMRNEEENSWAYCAGCPVGGCENEDIVENTDYLVRGAIDLIHRLQDENKRLKKQLKSLQEDMKLEVGIRNKEIERLNKENDQLVIEKRIIKDQKYEALQKLDEMTNKCNEIYWFKHYEQAEKDTAKEILQELYDQIDENTPKWVGVQIKIIAKRKGVEVEDE